MSVGDCPELNPIGTCGLFGECVNASSGQLQCLCRSGWKQSREMALFFVTEEDFDEGRSFCHGNDIFLTLLYGIALVAVVIIFIYQMSLVKKRSQLKRLTPFIIGCILSISFCVYRLVLFDEALFGSDLTFSIIIANNIFLDLTAITIFLQKYFKYLTKRVPFSDAKLLKRFKRFKTICLALTFLDLVNCQFFWIPLNFSDKTGLGQIVLRVSFGIAGIRGIFFGYTADNVFDQFLKDMRDLINVEKQILDVAPATNPSPVVTVIVTRLLPRTEDLRFVALTLAGVFTGFMLVPAIWPLM